MHLVGYTWKYVCDTRTHERQTTMAHILSMLLWKERHWHPDTQPNKSLGTAGLPRYSRLIHLTILTTCTVTADMWVHNTCTSQRAITRNIYCRFYQIRTYTALSCVHESGWWTFVLHIYDKIMSTKNVTGRWRIVQIINVTIMQIHTVHSPTDAHLLKLWLQFTLKLDGYYMFRSTTIIRELAIEPG